MQDLKKGTTAIEERARTDLGMVGQSETFYQVVTPKTAAPAPPAQSSNRSARACNTEATPNSPGRDVPSVSAAVRGPAILGSRAGRGQLAAHGPGAVPKQYLPLAGRTVLEWSLAPFLARADCAAIVVVLAPDDQRWRELERRARCERS